MGEDWVETLRALAKPRVTEPVVAAGLLSPPGSCATAGVRVGISVGVAHSAARFGDDVLDAADQALYQAKAEGGSTVRFPEDDRR